MIILNGIATKPEKKSSMVPVEVGIITPMGLEGNYYSSLRNFIRSSRQITVVSEEAWCDVMLELHSDIPWHMHRANLCVAGHLFSEEDVGKSLMIGELVELEITGECDPCNRMDLILPGLQDVLRHNWRGGVTCKVIEGGQIRVGDECRLEWP